MRVDISLTLLSALRTRFLLLGYLVQSQKEGFFHVLLIWNFLSYAVNMFYNHWLKKKLLWPVAGQNIARQEIQAEIEEERRLSQRGTM